MAVTAEEVLLFCARFDRATHALTRRARRKPAFAITDEYDVQDLAYAALKPLVDDLTQEDPTNKVAGTSGRLDLFSRRLGLAIEVKAALKEGCEAEITRECFERVKLYSSAPGIRVLAFFIHDPDENVQRGLEGRGFVDHRRR